MTVAFQTALHIRDLYTDLKLLGEEMTGSTPMIVLEGRTTPTGLRERLYFESGSGLLRRRSTINEGAYGDYLTDIYYDEYRSIDGIMMPLMISEFTPDFGTVRKLRTVDHDAVPNPAIFAKPEK